jgi:hypothetical protein
VDPVLNPFRPGAGRRPPLLAGRQSVLEAFTVVRRRAEELGEGDRSWVLHGLRGVGKTVLLGELLAQVSERGWITAKVEAGAAPSLSVALGRALVRAMRTATGRHPEPRLRRLLGVFKAFSIKVDPTGAVALGVDVQPIEGIADSGRLADDLAGLFEVLGETARDLRIGVLVLIDELRKPARSSSRRSTPRCTTSARPTSPFRSPWSGPGSRPSRRSSPKPPATQSGCTTTAPSACWTTAPPVTRW